jgi:adenylate cyclase
MADVFVSYARSDKHRVAPIVRAIEDAGWSVWWDPAISPGQEFDARISDELSNASVILVVWTPTSVASRWVRGEAREGADRNVLVPVRFEKAQLPIDVRALQTIDLDVDDIACSPHLQELLRALGAIIARQRPAPAPVPAARSGRVSVCVLPFANMSGDREQEYFSDGITEDIITDLSKVSALSVISRNSAFVFKGRHVDVPKVARELAVSHVLEGSVRKAGGRVRITAQLVDGASNDHVWAERYDRDLEDIFALQDEIAHAIVNALKLQLLPAEKRAIENRGTDNAEAYNLYLMARQHYAGGTEGDLRRAEAIIRLCTRATEIDPRYARAWALLGLGHVLLRYVRGGSADEGMAAAERALALDPNLAEAHSIKARVFSEDGRFELASAEIDRALQLDPESYEVNRSAAYLRYRQRRLEDAVRFFEKAMTLLETDINSANMLVACYTALGDQQRALRAAGFMLATSEKMLAQDSSNVSALAYGAGALAMMGDAERAREWRNRALVLDPDSIKMRYNFACDLAGRFNDTDAALELLDWVFKRIASGMLNHAKTDPDLDSLRADPRFNAMVAAAEARLAAAPNGPTRHAG